MRSALKEMSALDEHTHTRTYLWTIEKYSKLDGDVESDTFDACGWKWQLEWAFGDDDMDVSLDLYDNEDDQLEVVGIATCALVSRDGGVLHEKRQLFKAGPDDSAQWSKFVQRTDVASYLDQDTLRVRCTICAFDLNEWVSLVSLSQCLGKVVDTGQNRCE